VAHAGKVIDPGRLRDRHLHYLRGWRSSAAEAQPDHPFPQQRGAVACPDGVILVVAFRQRDHVTDVYPTAILLNNDRLKHVERR